jgi:hypothetical protein
VDYGIGDSGKKKKPKPSRCRCVDFAVVKEEEEAGTASAEMSLAVLGPCKHIFVNLKRVYLSPAVM